MRTQAVILKSETYNFHRLDLTRQAGFIVTVYDEDGLRLAATMPCSTPAVTFAEGRKIVDGKIEGSTPSIMSSIVPMATPNPSMKDAWRLHVILFAAQTRMIMGM
jgi:hypothetical protein